MKESPDYKKIAFKALIVVSFFAITGVIWYSKIYSEKQGSIVLKTQYTFTTRIDYEGNVYPDDGQVHTGPGKELNKDVINLGIDNIGRVWLSEFTNQFEQKYVSKSKRLTNVRIIKSQILNEKDKIVMLEFSCVPLSSTPEFFSSWDGNMADEIMVCQWVVKFEIEDLYDGTSRVYAKSVLKPEDYGISEKTVTDNKNQATEKDDSSSNMYLYQLKNEKLMVSYDKGEKWTSVPLDFISLMSGRTDKNELPKGSYEICAYKTAFLYGGNISSGQNFPLTLMYSDDKGSNWVSTLISDVTKVTYWNVEFQDVNNGFVIVGYQKNATQEKSIILRTMDGGETWSQVGSAPVTAIISDVLIIDENNIFISFEYTDGMISSLYRSTDGGVSFEPVIPSEQQFSGTVSKLTWNEVYKCCQLPALDKKGVLTLKVTQGNNGSYNGGDTVAKYQSSDKGNTWKFIGEE